MILVFAGAGSSAAVDSEQYPTTIEFFNRLPDNIKQDSLFAEVCNFLASQKEEGQPVDIEEVLWALDELQDYCSISSDARTMSGWIMRNERINNFIPNLPSIHPQFNGGMSKLIGRIVALRGQINEQVYKFYRSSPEPIKLRTWIELLKSLANYDPIIEIFTTNYDRVLENVIKSSEINMETGRKFDGLQAKLDTTRWDTSDDLSDNNGRLTKLHGSVDWQQSTEGINISEVFTGDHQNHLILYPGYKGEPDEEPFVKFHRHLRAVVRQATGAVFIGYAFRDQYINTILSEFPPKIPKIVINKDSSLPDLPFLKGAKHFSEGLTKETAKVCINSLYPKSASGRGANVIIRNEGKTLVNVANRPIAPKNVAKITSYKWRLWLQEDPANRKLASESLRIE